MRGTGEGHRGGAWRRGTGEDGEIVSYHIILPTLPPPARDPLSVMHTLLQCHFQMHIGESHSLQPFTVHHILRPVPVHYVRIEELTMVLSTPEKCIRLIS